MIVIFNRCSPNQSIQLVEETRNHTQSKRICMNLGRKQRFKCREKSLVWSLWVPTGFNCYHQYQPVGIDETKTMLLASKCNKYGERLGKCNASIMIPFHQPAADFGEGGGFIIAELRFVREKRPKSFPRRSWVMWGIMTRIVKLSVT